MPVCTTEKCSARRSIRLSTLVMHARHRCKMRYRRSQMLLQDDMHASIVIYKVIETRCNCCTVRMGQARSAVRAHNVRASFSHRSCVHAFCSATSMRCTLVACMIHKISSQLQRQRLLATRQRRATKWSLPAFHPHPCVHPLVHLVVYANIE